MTQFRMAVTSILYFVAISFGVAAPSSLPQSAFIVDNDPSRKGLVIGNVEVLFKDGHKEKWTRNGGALMPDVSPNGFIGWARVTGKNSYGESVDNKLRVCRPDGRYFDLLPGLPFIEEWKFSTDGATVIIKSRGRHGPALYEEFDVESGQSLTHAGGGARGDALPEWARPFSD
jgi:hypothetical protein